ncbi:MAG: hypothetical protein R2784_11155 [Saprospiraceae bacterium]
MTDGDYTVTVTDVNGSDVQTVTLENLSTLSLNVDQEEIYVQLIILQKPVTATDGIAPYSYEWSTGSTSDTIRNLTNGDYEITLTDSGGSSHRNHKNIQFIHYQYHFG